MDMRKHGQRKGGADNDMIINKLVERITPTEQSPENMALLASDLHNRIESLYKYKVDREMPHLMPQRNYTMDGLRRLAEDQSLRPELNLINDYVGHTVQEESEMLRTQQKPFKAERYRPTPHLSTQQESDIYRSLKHKPLTKKEKKEIAKLEKQFLAQHPGIELTKPEHVALELEEPKEIEEIGPVSSTLPKNDLYKLTKAIKKLSKNVGKDDYDYEDIQKESRKFANALDTFRSQVPTDDFLLSKFLEREEKAKRDREIKAQRLRVETSEIERRKDAKRLERIKRRLQRAADNADIQEFRTIVKEEGYSPAAVEDLERKFKKDPNKVFENILNDYAKEEAQDDLERLQLQEELEEFHRREPVTHMAEDIERKIKQDKLNGVNLGKTLEEYVNEELETELEEKFRREREPGITFTKQEKVPYGIPMEPIVPEGQERVVYKRPENFPIFEPFEADQPVVYEPPWYKSLLNRVFGETEPVMHSPLVPTRGPYEGHEEQDWPFEERISYQSEAELKRQAKEREAEDLVRMFLEQHPEEKAEELINPHLNPPEKEKGELGEGRRRRRKKGGISHEAAVLEYRRKPRINQMKGVPYPYYFELNPYKMKLNEADLFTPVRKLYNHADYLAMHGQGKEPLRSYAPHGPTTARKPRRKTTNKKM